MLNMSDGGQTELKDIIEEVFLQPVRSVLLVDDEYPTLDKMLTGYINNGDVWSKSKAKAKDNAARVRDVINFCREPKRNWHVDVHDGENVTISEETASIQNLHQSDLLLLDFHLDGDSQDPSKCLSILRALADSDHFNLVVVVTKEESEPTFLKVLPEFLKPKFSEALDRDAYLATDTVISDWAFEEELPIKENLKNCFPLDAYIRMPPAEKIDLADKYLIPYLSSFEAVLKTAPAGVDKKKILLWSLINTEKMYDLKGTSIAEFSSLDADQKWLCARNLFLTVVKKVDEQQGQTIIDALTAALVSWNPPANRLMLLKFRSEIEAKGLSIGDELFSQRNMQALWLYNLIKADKETRNSEIDVSIARHGETLVSLVGKPIRDIVSRSLLLENKASAEQRVHDVFGVIITNEDIRRLAAIEHNTAVSNCAVKGWHLETGHIFKYKNEYWIVLTPACDLVPSQTKGRSIQLGGLMPFKAVKLRVLAQSHKAVLSNVDHNLTTFIEIDGEPVFLHLLIENSANSAAHWNEFYAQKRGMFNEGSFNLRLATTLSEDGEVFNNEWIDTSVVAQLRYEYAINLLQTLGAKTSRVGLEFIKGL